MKSLNRIGIFGGTFNPIDNAHIAIVKQFIQELNIDKCYIIPVNISPFKTTVNNNIQIEGGHRIQMLKLAFANEQRIVIDTYEIEKGGISYSYDTIQYLKSKHPNSEIFVLIGSDQAVSFKEWKEWDWILKNTHLCIAMREGFSEPMELKKLLRIGNISPIILSSPIIKISATDVRLKLLEGQSINEYVPRKVEDYIKTNNLFVRL